MVRERISGPLGALRERVTLSHSFYFRFALSRRPNEKIKKPVSHSKGRPAFLFLNAGRGIGTSKEVHKIAGTSTWKYEVEPVRNIGSSNFELPQAGLRPSGRRGNTGTYFINLMRRMRGMPRLQGCKRAASHADQF